MVELSDTRRSLERTCRIKQKVIIVLRNYGYNSYYKPTLERSIKRKIMEELGDDYVRAVPFS